jgi:hypothetical protein
MTTRERAVDKIKKRIESGRKYCKEMEISDETAIVPVWALIEIVKDEKYPRTTGKDSCV